MQNHHLRLIFAAIIAAASLATLYFDWQAGLLTRMPGASRTALAVLGLISAALLASGPTMAGTVGWMLALAWALVQIPIYTTAPNGWINQTVLRLPIAFTSSRTTGGELTFFMHAGINLAALILAAMVFNRRSRFGQP